MRIAVGGIHIECSTYNPVLTQEHDFRVVRGDDLLEAPYFAFLRDYDATFLPTLHARCIPGGPVARDVYESFKADFLERLKAQLPLDGLYLAMHGAMNVEGMEDAEGDWISAARALVGPDCPISASYDLHGNLSQRIIDQLDMYSTYRTAPHIDVEETMRRSVTMLVRAIQSRERPHIVWAPIPVVLPGERTSTVDEPAKSLYADLHSIDSAPGIWDASLNVGYVWADEPRATAAAIMTGTDRAALERAAEALAQRYWDVREAFVFGPETGSIEECVAKAVASDTGPVILAESGDNPTGGGVGDRAELFAALVAAGATDTIFAGITDLAATEAAYDAGVGQTLTLTIGASLDTAGSIPFSGTFEVIYLAEAQTPADRQAVLRIGGIDLVVTARRRPFHDIADFTSLGLDPRTAKIVGVKSGYLSPELAPIANPNLLVLSPGSVDQFIERLPRDRKQTPTYPFDKDFAFTPRSFASARADRNT
ncbi:MAG TPA: M81 family metallopeptidase [Pelagibacterium sp.]|uniref:M81 family metallopeptidase n=1 Tax=Pelagibacterium sp. TaxID=1967288 RepID=UPI002D11406F|nr:M81 family metallopeptidase [Pelagibacterium sp.]HWJ87455.1 M81 family metallopeptidase [Pelagibacterium sp.]